MNGPRFLPRVSLMVPFWLELRVLAFRVSVFGSLGLVFLGFGVRGLGVGGIKILVGPFRGPFMALQG